MKKNRTVAQGILAFVVGMALLASTGDAFARDGDRHGGRGGGHGWGHNRGHSREVVVVGHDRYHYYGGRFYRPSWFGFEIALSIPPVGAVITTLPYGHRTMVVGGLPYYYYDGVYYRTCPTGYIVVPEPAVVTVPVVPSPRVVSGETVTVNVPNTNGSYTAVTLVRRSNGFVGPQGELYTEFPTVEQLRLLYGK